MKWFRRRCGYTFTPFDGVGLDGHTHTCRRRVGHEGAHVCYECGANWTLRGES